jgi:hypothetical protein
MNLQGSRRPMKGVNSGGRATLNYVGSRQRPQPERIEITEEIAG